MFSFQFSIFLEYSIILQGKFKIYFIWNISKFLVCLRVGNLLAQTQFYSLGYSRINVLVLADDSLYVQNQQSSQVSIIQNANMSLVISNMEEQMDMFSSLVLRLEYHMIERILSFHCKYCHVQMIIHKKLIEMY